MNSLLKKQDGDAPFKGYGIDELRYRRAFALAKCEMAKIQLTQQVGHFKGTVASPTGVMGKIASSLNYLDYALIAYQIGSKIYKWRKNRKK